MFLDEDMANTGSSDAAPATDDGAMTDGAVETPAADENAGGETAAV